MKGAKRYIYDDPIEQKKAEFKEKFTGYKAEMELIAQGKKEIFSGAAAISESS